MKKILIIGASGMAGRALYKQAIKNPDLDITGIVRNKEKAESILGTDAKLIIGDVLKQDKEFFQEFDVIVDALGTAPEEASEQVALAKKLTEAAQDSPLKLIFILGAGSLYTGADKHYFVEDIAKMPDSEEWINIPKQQLKEYQYLKTTKGINWMGISPSASFEEGPAKKYVIGHDELLFDNDGKSIVYSGTMAEVILKEISEDRYHQERITVINA